MKLKNSTSVFAFLAVFAAMPSMAAQSSSAAPGTAGVVTEEVVVLGTRRADRTITESPVPVDVLSSSELGSLASSDMNNVLRALIPSFNVGRFVGINSDGSGFVRPPTLRGLPPDQILVLVNGKRRHRSALVQLNGGALASGAQGADLAQIPTIAIERIEVLRDGAAAQYGSDAIAGVINYTLRTAPDGIEMRARYGQFYKGDGTNYQFQGNVGLPLGPSGFINSSVEYAKSGNTSRGGQRIGALAVSLARPDLKTDAIAQKIGDPDVEAYRFFVNSGFDINDSSEVYLFGNRGLSRQEFQFNYRQPVTVTGPAQSGVGTQTYAQSSVYNNIYLDRLPDGRYDANGRFFNFRSLYPNGFTPYFHGKVNDVSITGGYRGEMNNGVTYDVSSSYGQSNIKYTMQNSINASMGPDSPTSFYMGSLEQRETNFNADFTYPVEIGLASPLTIAAGGEHRVEAYQVGLGDYASYAAGPYTVQTLNNGTVLTQAPGTSGFPGYSPNFVINNNRKSYAAYVDFEADLLENFSVGVAGRHENFSDFGSTTNGKISARYAFTEMVAIRGAASTGFRAPTPGQLFTTAGITGFVGASPTDNLTLPASNAASVAFGSSPLTPEKSVNLAGGIVLTPGGSVNVTVDYYNIKVKDRIGLAAYIPITTDAQRETLRAAGLSNWATVGQIRFFANGFVTRTQGVDITGSHRFQTDIGEFSSTIAVNYNRAKVLSRKTNIVDDVRKGNIEESLPRIRGTFTETWSLDPFSITGRAYYYAGFTSWALPANGGNLNVKREVLFDLEANYNFNEHFSFSVGAENILNNYPDRAIRSRTNYPPQPAGTPVSNWYEPTQAAVDGSRYIDSSPFGYNGGYWFARVTARF